MDTLRSNIDNDARISMSKFLDNMDELKIDKDTMGNKDIIEHLKMKNYLRRLQRGKVLGKVYLIFML